MIFLSHLLNPSTILLGIAFTFLILSHLYVLCTSLKKKTELKQRIHSWWVILILLTLAIIWGATGLILLFAIISFFSLKEFFSVIPTRRADRRVLFWAYIAIVFQYIWIAKEWYGMFMSFIPIFVFLLLPVRMILIGETKGFLRSIGTIHWGTMTSIYSLSHVAYLFILPKTLGKSYDGAPLVLFLIFVTELGDVYQFISGKLFGKRKVSPKISPNKTLAGLLGGVVLTTLTALLLGPLLTPMNLKISLLAGILISLFGFFGDLTMSAVKRDLKIKDMGTLLPGHGGINDRLDSLIFTAPIFFHLMHYLDI